jgi:hypothetical protein
MIKRCRIWLFGAAVITMGALTSGFMAAQATAKGAADSFLSALFTPPQQQVAPPAWLSNSRDGSGIDSAVFAARSAAPFSDGERGQTAMPSETQPRR